MSGCKKIIELLFCISFLLFVWTNLVRAEQTTSSECRVPKDASVGFCLNINDFPALCHDPTAAVQKSTDCASEEWCCIGEKIETPARRDIPTVPAAPSTDSVDSAPCGHGNGVTRSAAPDGLPTSIRRFARIFRGTPVDLGDTCWVAAIFDRGNASRNLPFSYVCTATIINSTHIATAAHCVDDYLSTPEQIEVHTGVTDASSVPVADEGFCKQKFRVSNIVVSSAYDPTTLNLDMAILRLAEVIKVNECTCRVCLLDRGVSDTSTLSTCWAAGFGAVREGAMSTLQLTKSKVDFIRKDRCEVMLGDTLSGFERFKLPEATICAGDVQQGGLCPKDGGAPLTCIIDGRHTLVGIGSWSLDCSRLPSVFSSLFSCQTFLQNPEQPCQEHVASNKAVFALNRLEMTGGPTCGVPGVAIIDPLSISKQQPSDQLATVNKFKSAVAGMQGKHSALTTSFQMLSDQQIILPEFDDTVISRNRLKIDMPTTVQPPFAAGLIVGGMRTAPNEVCWQVLISSGCGGSIISDQFILTAAHCVTIKGTTTPKDHRGLKVVLGARKSPLTLPLADSCQQIRAVRRVVVHPDYFLGNSTDQYVNADIAILELESPIDFSQPCVCRICLQNSEPTPGEMCSTTGFGCQSPTTPGQPCSDQQVRELMKLRIAMPGDDVCSSFFSASYPRQTLTCSASSNGEGVCFGDSGGPLVCYNNERNSYYQAGITSFAIFPDGAEKCAGGDTNFQYYTKVLGFLNWIRQQVPDVMVTESSSFSFRASFKIDLGNGLTNIVTNNELLPSLNAH